MKLEREFKEVFDFYSEGNDPKNQKVDFEQIAVIADKINLQKTDDELKKFLSQINDSNTEKIPYKGFVELFDKKLFSDVPKPEALEAFTLFDKDKEGKINIDDFRHVMKNLCDDMTPDEIEDFLSVANEKGDGFIHYKEFIDILQN